MNNPEYLEWLNHYNISRPHKTGRWRVWWNDTLTVSCPPDVIAVADFESFHPSETEWGYFCCWRDSDERKFKQNAAGFLRSAKYRHLIDGSGENQVKRVKEMCSNIRAAMIFFARGEIPNGKEAMSSAWGAYMILQTLSTWPLVNLAVKHKGKQRDKGIKRGEQLSREKAAKDSVEVIRGRGNVSEIVKNLALKEDQFGDYFNIKDELWPELIGSLDELGLNPREITDDKRQPVRIAYRDGDGKQGEIKFSSFKVMVSNARKTKS